jgi:hypothetical protein
MTQSPQQTLNYCKIILCAIHKVRRRKHSEYDSKSIRSSAQYVTLDVKLDQEKSKHGALVQKNGFGPKILHSLLRLVKREECNKFNLTAGPFI